MTSEKFSQCYGDKECDEKGEGGWDGVKDCYFRDQTYQCLYERNNEPAYTEEWSEEYRANLYGCFSKTPCRAMVPEMFDCY